MLNTISWEVFFTTLVILTAAYYFIATLLLYNREIIHWCKSVINPSPPAADSSQGMSSPAVMGPINADIIFNNDTLQADVLIGTVSDLLQEVKTLLQLACDNQWDKVKCQSLFHALFARYAQLKDTTHQKSICLFISDQVADELSFSLTMDEVMNWWNKQTTTYQ